MITERLSGPVNVLITESHRSNPDRGTDGHDQLFLHLFGYTIYGRRMNGRILGRSDQLQRFRTAGIFALEVAPLHIFIGARQWVDISHLFTQITTFAVYGARSGDNDLRYRMLCIREYIQHQRSSADIDSRVFLDLVHRLSGAGFRREGDNGIDAFKGAQPVVTVGDAALDKTHTIFDTAI